MARPRLLVLTGTLAIVASVVAQMADAQPPSALYDARTIRTKLRELHTRINGIHVVYEVVSDNDQELGEYLHRVVKMKRPDQYFESYHHGSARIDWRRDIFFTEHYLLGNSFFVYEPTFRVCRTGKISNDHPLPENKFIPLFLLGTSIWLIDRPSPKWGDQWVSLNEMIDARLDVLQNQEQIDGHWCHVIDAKGCGRAWIDLQRDCCILAREFVDKAQTQALRIRARQHREIVDGVWLPMEMKFSRFRRGTSGDPNSDIPNKSNQLKVLELRVNTNHDIRFQSKPGTIQVDENGYVQSQQQGGTDYLDEMVVHVKEYTLSSTALQNTRNVLYFDTYVLPVLVVAIVILICEITLRVLRLRKRRLCNHE